MGRSKTLTARLIATSSAWVVVALAATALVLVWLFRDHTEVRFDRVLADHLEELVAASEVDGDGAVRLAWEPFAPRFNRPYSGWYWQIERDGRIVARSPSLWRGRLRVDATGGPGRRAANIRGPDQKRLRAVVQAIDLPRSDRPLVYVVAGPVSDIDRDVGRFTAQLSVTLTVLAVGLLTAVLFQVRFGLRPLGDLRASVAAIRAGRSTRLPERFPAEIEPVVEELNALLDHEAKILERARAQAADLAHALKNPLTVIANEAREVPHPQGAVLAKEAAAMTGVIERHLSLARAAAHGSLGTRTPVGPVMEDLRFSLERLYRDRALELRIAGCDDLVFRGDARDLEEMAGNLLDNACKWARRVVRVTGAPDGERIEIAVEDDGPGVPPERYEEVLVRGRRLDEAIPGSGIGLGIVNDIAGAYDGLVELSASGLGGLRVTLRLPRVV